MRIGLISDTHNDQRSVRQALSRLRVEQVTTLLHAGDVTNAATLRLFADFDVWIARGNMDRDPGLLPVAHELFGAGRLRTLQKINLEGHAIALTHSNTPESRRELVESQAYDYVIFGHTHRTQDERVGPTRVINPGALSTIRWHVPTFAILDLATDDLSWIKL